VIFYGNPEQARIARETLSDVDRSGAWPGAVVTQVEPFDSFWEAEPEHQDYLLRNPHGYTCHFPRPQWKLPARAR
jgi:peptide-methionine (S)-S-oxide reductase